ncbi:hypothetical protein K1T71_002139 [Dendrolimus kikuchii]|uniref:Uncharacterized protein n=1 Tax=Dendrolimus kikuchii TaxID=765133 RepID=A0ACC1DG30_9NEOP|nr:hypothetical protein K1T71_002139 [Dendrolimus kikuchii]
MFLTSAEPISLPAGQSVVAISSSGPTGQKYFASASASQQRSFGRDAWNPVQSFSVASPVKSVAGTGRSFNTLPINNPAIDLNWLRNLESFYDPQFNTDGATSIIAINENGHIYGKINNVPFDNAAKKL